MSSAIGTRRTPSISDVAAAAGVSMQTVSRVARGLDNVQPATRDRVEDAMQRLGYRPNRAARALRTGRFRSIGVVVFTLDSFGNMRTIEAISAAAAAADHSITLIAATGRTRRDITTALARLEGQAVDGVVLLIEAHILDETEIPLPGDVPVVIIDSNQRPDAALVDTDQALGARQAVEHLLGLGHDTVWHIAGPAGSYSADRREAAWRDVLTEHGRAIHPAQRGDWTVDSGHRIGRLLAMQDSVTAIFAANDQMALGLLKAAHELDRSVPRTLSVVGFDDMPESAGFWPALTTIHQDFEDVGRRAVRVLLRLLEGGPTDQQVVPTRLVVRDSTAEPARGGP